MDDLISRQAALDAIDKNRKDLLSLGMDGAEHILVHYGRRVIEELPTAEKIGKWIGSEDFDEYYRCSECGKGETQFGGLYRYCPNCGARMEGEEDEPTTENR